MNQKSNNVAYIDGANLHRGITSLGWELNYRNFYRWLEDKYSVRRAYIFLGMMSAYASLYNFLQKAGFIDIWNFRKTVITLLVHGKRYLGGGINAGMALA